MQHESGMVRERSEMVELLRRYGISNPRVLDAFLTVGRHLFVDGESRRFAYHDSALPIGFGQTISQPYTVAYMMELLVDRCPRGKVLEIGTGSGYQAAILNELGYRVFTIERVAGLHELAAARFEKLGIPVRSRFGDGTLGWPDQAPFDAIIVTAAAPHEPRTLMDQLADGGVLILPLGTLVSQQMTIIRRNGGQFEHERFDNFAFVPLLGREGWPEPDE